MKKILSNILAILTFIVVLSTNAYASGYKEDLSKGNEYIDKAIESVKTNNIDQAKEYYDKYNAAWVALEDGVKKDSKKAYGDIEEKMGMVQFLFSQKSVQGEKLISALEELKQVNKEVIEGKYKNASENTEGKKITIKDLVVFLDEAKNAAEAGDTDKALKEMNEFSSSWIEIEGVVLTKSQKIYNDAEKDMVTVKAYLKTNDKDKAIKTINRMKGYLSPLEETSSYSIVDVITIILREGLEALLVVIALLGFLKKSGNEKDKSWVYGGVIIGLVVSVVIAVLVKILFSSGTFGNNNFLIGGWTGIFASVMLIYVSYWLHSKSSAMEWQNYIKTKSSKALAAGSLFSIGLLAFLAVFREGTETVLFYIGMASSISLANLLLGIAIGMFSLIAIAFIVLKLGLKIPMKPFFMVSSLLVFYLAIKFTGMGINGLQLAGIIPATTMDSLPTIPWLAVYPSLEGTIPQLVLIIAGIAVVVINKIKSRNYKIS